MKALIFAFAASVLLFNAVVSADQIILKNGLNGYNGTTDTYIDEDNETTNYGSLWYMQTYMTYDDSDEASLVKFDLSGKIPQNAQITSASLSLWVNELINMTSSDWLQVGAYRIRNYKDWVETQANWNVFKGSTWWATVGCENTSFDRYSNPDSHLTFYNTSQINRYYSWDVTSSVQSWYNGTEQNNGWLVRAVAHDGGTDGIKMNTKDGGSDYRPYLLINYNIIPEPATLILLSLGTLLLRKSKTN